MSLITLWQEGTCYLAVMSHRAVLTVPRDASFSLCFQLLLQTTPCFQLSFPSPITSSPFHFHYLSSMHFTHVGVLSACTSGTQKRPSDPTGLELWTAVSCGVGAGNWTEDHQKGSQRSSGWAVSPAPPLFPISFSSSSSFLFLYFPCLPFPIFLFPFIFFWFIFVFFRFSSPPSSLPLQHLCLSLPRSLRLCLVLALFSFLSSSSSIDFSLLSDLSHHLLLLSLLFSFLFHLLWRLHPAALLASS